MDLALIKNHLIVEHDLDDPLIQMYADAAEVAITNYIHSDYNPDNKVHAQAKLLLTGTWYTHRESVVTGVSSKDLPHGIVFLLDMVKGVVL